MQKLQLLLKADKEHKVFPRFPLVKFGNGKSLKMKFGNQTNLNMLSLMVMFTFSVLDQKYSF